MSVRKDLYIMEVLRVLLTSILSVVTLFILTKIMGNRQMSQLSMFDYINGITIGSIASEMSFSDEFLYPLIAMIVYATSSILVSYCATKNLKWCRFLNGTPLILFDKDKFHFKSFKKAKLDINEFLCQCRSLGYFNLNDVQTAILEANGKITILPKSTKRPLNANDLNLNPVQEMPSINVICNGEILHDNLKSIGKDEVWLRRKLSEDRLGSPKDILLAFCDETNSITTYKY